MSGKIIELVQVLVDRIEKNGYQQRAREENAFDLNKRLTEAEGWVAHWKQARQEAHEAGELMRAEIETLRQQLVEQQAETVDVRRQRNNETDRLNATNAVSVQQRDEIAYLRARLDEERSVSAGLRQKLAEQQEKVESAERDAEWCRTQYRQMMTQLDAAHAAVTLQRAGIEQLQAFVGGIDNLLEQDRFDRRDIAELLIVLRSNSSATLTSSVVKESLTPAPVAEQAEGGA